MTKIEVAEQKLQILSQVVSRKSVGRNASFQDKLTTFLAVMRPVLEAFEAFWFTPKKWKKVIRTFLQVIDTYETTDSITFENEA